MHQKLEEAEDRERERKTEEFGERETNRCIFTVLTIFCLIYSKNITPRISLPSITIFTTILMIIDDIKQVHSSKSNHDPWDPVKREDVKLKLHF